MKIQCTFLFFFCSDISSKGARFQSTFSSFLRDKSDCLHQCKHGLSGPKGHFAVIFLPLCPVHCILWHSVLETTYSSNCPKMLLHKSYFSKPQQWFCFIRTRANKFFRFFPHVSENVNQTDSLNFLDPLDVYTCLRHECSGRGFPIFIRRLLHGGRRIRIHVSGN